MSDAAFHQPSSSSSTTAPRRSLQQSGQLRDFLVAQCKLVTHAIQNHTRVQFNDWLVEARAKAKIIGSKAIKKAAAARQGEEDESKARRAASDLLDSTRSITKCGGHIRDSMMNANTNTNASTGGGKEGADGGKGDG